MKIRPSERKKLKMDNSYQAADAKSFVKAHLISEKLCLQFPQVESHCKIKFTLLARLLVIRIKPPWNDHPILVAIICVSDVGT